jgi:hypothetical protein
MVDYFSTAELVDVARDCLHIRTLKSDMSDDEIRAVVKWIGQHSSCARCKGEKPFCTSLDLLLMLIITAAEFPKFFVKFELFEEN